MDEARHCKTGSFVIQLQGAWGWHEESALERSKEDSIHVLLSHLRPAIALRWGGKLPLRIWVR